MPLQIQTDRSLTSLNTFGFQQVARHYVEVDTDDELVEALQLAREEAWPLHLLGGGSNLVLCRDLPGLTIRMVGKQIRYDREDPSSDTVVVATAQAGVSWHGLVLDSLQQGYGGLENLSLIPGTVGAAPVQNIGAYGVELADRIVSLDAFQIKTQTWVTLNAEACQFGYRSSVFKRCPGEFIITRVRFRLSSNMPLQLSYAGLNQHLQDAGIQTPSYRNVSNAVIAIRRQKLPDPARIGNAGSFFQNPVIDASKAKALKADHPGMVCHEQADGRVKVAAGWLVDSLGYKGVTRGGVGVHEHQALVLVHYGGATGEELLALADDIASAVLQRYGITLVIEPVIL